MKLSSVGPPLSQFEKLLAYLGPGSFTSVTENSSPPQLGRRSARAVAMACLTSTSRVSSTIARTM